MVILIINGVILVGLVAYRMDGLFLPGDKRILKLILITLTVIAVLLWLVDMSMPSEGEIRGAMDILSSKG